MDVPHKRSLCRRERSGMLLSAVSDINTPIETVSLGLPVRGLWEKMCDML